ncbi:DNRLRE domain-containing protein [Chondromyces apiculatus]|uniref:Carbohydrate-binding module family 96 domain-containing protein n=1 Tax=Chondromyces apiculatus DSM 436 TaxID=1192034 RepID=A0A017T2Y6_9BACT|nr:DNRLRE domain-containing protein [Chondromyces apiculatus]EYF03210.1 Hypothetical protein CAP_5714 [Chondromyces apiculatus DSM 436]
MDKRYSATLAITGLTLALSGGGCVMEADPEGAPIPGEEPRADGVVDVVSESDDAIGGVAEVDDEDGDRIIKPTTCITIRRGSAGEVHDATIYHGSPDYNAGGIPTLGTGMTTMRKLALLSFDLSLLPTNIRITEAHLGLTQSWNEVINIIHIRRITAPWSEHEVTWQSFHEAYEPASLARFVTKKGENHYKVDVTDALVSRVERRSEDSVGFVLDTFGRPNTFLSSEHEAPEGRPFLHVCYFGGMLPPH